jgi:hypothetical protein
MISMAASSVVSPDVWALGLRLGAALTLAGGQLAGQIRVNTGLDANDAYPEDLVCDTTFDPRPPNPVPASNLCTLRAAIQTVNRNPAGRIIQIRTTIVVTPAAALPPIDSTVTIEPAPGTSGRASIDGRNAGPVDGLHLRGRRSVIRGISITGFAGAALTITGDSSIVTGNWLGLDVAAAAAPNETGLRVLGARGVSVGGDLPGLRNIISENAGEGIRVTDATGTRIAGNHVGISPTGITPMGNKRVGIVIERSRSTRIGDGPTRRNVVSGNTLGGITIIQSEGTLVLDNFIGLDQNGLGTLQNGGTGIYVRDSPNTIIGDDPNTATISLAVGTGCGAVWRNLPQGGNVIAGNDGAGITVEGRTSTGVVIAQNRIGTDSSGTRRLGNTGVGVFIVQSPGVIIGGSRQGAGNLISGNRTGVLVSGLEARGTRVFGNLIGTSVTGFDPLGNDGIGIHILDAPESTIGSGRSLTMCNLVSGNGTSGSYSGIYVQRPGARDAVVEGNFVGVDQLGMDPIGNSGNGITIDGAPAALVGGANTSNGWRGNVVAANGMAGIAVLGDSAAGTRILGNNVGMNAWGSAELFNLTAVPGTSLLQSAGIAITNAPDIMVGDTILETSNLVSGGNRNGIVISGPRALNVRVQNNYIGVARDGFTQRGNRNAGVVIHEAPKNLIGRPTLKPGPPHGNQISGNHALGGGAGLQIEGDTAVGNKVAGNLIGTRRDGGDLGNSGTGVRIGHNASETQIGGPDSTFANVIAFNWRSGVVVAPGHGGRHSTRNAILSNSIHSNRGIGIDLNADSVSPSPRRQQAGLMGSPGPGPNNWQSAPYLYLVPDSGAGTLDARPNEQYKVQLFRSPAGSASGYGEGKTLVRTLDVLTNQNGFAWFELASILAGEVLSATATDPEGNTSEFSRLACDEGSPRSNALVVLLASWNQQGNTYRATAAGFSRPVLPVRPDQLVDISLKVALSNPAPDDRLEAVFVAVLARNRFGAAAQTGKAVVYSEYQPLDAAGRATLSVDPGHLLQALGTAPNTNVIEAEVQLCYRGRALVAPLENLLHIVLEKTTVFLPGVLGSEIYADTGQGAHSRVFPPLLPFRPFNGSILRLAFDPVTLAPRHQADSVALFESYLGPLVTIYDIDAPFAGAGRSLRGTHLPQLNVSGGPPIEYFHLTSWPYDWRLRLEDHVAALAARPGGRYTAPPLSEIIAAQQARHPLMDDRVALAGHSTGGLVIRSALSPVTGPTFRQWVDRAFFINVPLRGAPKSYFGLLTGKMVAGVLDSAYMQQIAPDMPIVYYLAPAAGYLDPHATPPDVVVEYPGAAGLVRQRRPFGAGTGYMQAVTGAAGVGRWVPSLAASADNFFRPFNRAAGSPPVIGWRNTLTFLGTQSLASTPGTVVVRGTGQVDLRYTRGDGTVPLGSLTAGIPRDYLRPYALTTTPPQPISNPTAPPAPPPGPGVPPPPAPLTIPPNDVAHDQAANSEDLWRQALRRLLEPDIFDFTAYLPRDSFPTPGYAGVSSEEIGLRETARLAARFGYDSLLKAVAYPAYPQGFDALYCDGEVVPKGFKAVGGALWYGCNGVLVIAESKGGYRGARLEGLLAMGYGFRQGTFEWARHAADTTLARPGPSSEQRRAAQLYLSAIAHGRRVRIETFHADWQRGWTRFYLLHAIY